MTLRLLIYASTSVLLTIIVLLLRVVVTAQPVVSDDTQQLHAATSQTTTAPPFDTAAFSLGRIFWHNVSSLRKDFPVGSFDFSGVAFGVTVCGNNPMPLLSVGISMTVRTTSDWETNRPHIFTAFLFEYDSPNDLPARINIPPPLHSAKRHFNFSTAQWENGTEYKVHLFNASRNTSITTTVWLIKETEPDWNRRDYHDNFVTFVAFQLERNLQTNTMQKSSVVQEVSPATPQESVEQGVPWWKLRQQMMPQQQQKKLVFIGDSITCGYCNLGVNITSNKTEYIYERFSGTWAFFIAAALEAEYQVVAWSGLGMAQNYHDVGNTTMYDIIPRTVATKKESWLYPYHTQGASSHTQEYVPQAVVVNLGTNDFANVTLSNNESQALVDEYKEHYEVVLRNLSFAFSPSLRVETSRPLTVFLACGPMDLRFCKLLDEIKEKVDKTIGEKMLRVERLTFAKLPDNQTSCGHPDLEGDIIMGRFGLKEIKKAMEW